jgi:hypothetical protein
MTCGASSPQGGAHPFLERAWLEVWDVGSVATFRAKKIIASISFVCLTSWPIIEIDDTRCGPELNGQWGGKQKTQCEAGVAASSRIRIALLAISNLLSRRSIAKPRTSEGW